MNIQKVDAARIGTPLATYHNTFHGGQTDLHLGDRSSGPVSSRSVSRIVRDSQSDSSVDELNAPDAFYDNSFRGGQKGLQFGNRSSGLFSNPSTSKPAGDSQTNGSVDEWNAPGKSMDLAPSVFRIFPVPTQPGSERGRILLIRHVHTSITRQKWSKRVMLNLQMTTRVLFESLHATRDPRMQRTTTRPLGLGKRQNSDLRSKRSPTKAAI